MVQRSLTERFCIWWWDENEDFGGHIARLLGWPVPVETDNVEIWNGGGAAGD